MKSIQGLQGLALVSASALLVTLPQGAWGAQTEITGVRLNSTPRGLQLIFNTQGNNRPPVFTVNRGNSSIADITDSQLRLPSGGTFRQENPAPGIKSVEVVQLNANTVRITVNGVAAAPMGEVVRRDPSGGLVMNFFPSQQPAGTATIPPAGQPPSLGQLPAAPPPFLPRAVAPPVGDIVVGPINANPDLINLGSNERIPRLLLRQAPVREVLTLLARAAGVNVAFAEEAGVDPTTAAGQTISLDIENESVQDVFNHVLQVTGLQANMVGRTIFIGRTLPPDAQNRIVRTYRLNQMRATATTTINQVLSATAQTGGSASGTSGSSSASSGSASFSASGSSGSLATSSVNRAINSNTTIEQLGALELLQAYGANGGGATTSGAQAPSSTLLRGLEVVADARTNTVTLIGSPRKVEIGLSLLTQFDVRKRQALINVKFVDVNLLKGQISNVDFSTNLGQNLFGILFDAAGLQIQQGTRSPNIFGPFVVPPTQDNPLLATPQFALPGLAAGQAVSDFFFGILVQIQNGNAKILTNPTLLVQEGSSAQVNLVQEIFSGIQATSTDQSTASGGGVAATTVTPIIRQAGVIFNVALERIDDNGFITLNVSPEVSAPSGTFEVVFPGVRNPSTGTLLAQRRLESGQIRLRDGQTLVLSGIIQDQDRSSVTKIPILGDIPLLGRLFRRENNQRVRNELIVMVTPKLVDDSQNAGFGYQYTPSPENQRLAP